MPQINDFSWVSASFLCLTMLISFFFKTFFFAFKFLNSVKIVSLFKLEFFL